MIPPPGLCFEVWIQEKTASKNSVPTEISLSFLITCVIVLYDSQTDHTHTWFTGKTLPVKCLIQPPPCLPPTSCAVLPAPVGFCTASSVWEAAVGSRQQACYVHWWRLLYDSYKAASTCKMVVMPAGEGERIGPNVTKPKRPY